MTAEGGGRTAHCLEESVAGRKGLTVRCSRGFRELLRADREPGYRPRVMTEEIMPEKRLTPCDRVPIRPSIGLRGGNGHAGISSAAPLRKAQALRLGKRTLVEPLDTSR